MISNKNQWKGKVSTIVMSALVAGLVVFATGYAATTISTNISTGGTLSVTGNATLSGSLIFGNSWTIASSTATTTQITVSDSSGNPVLILDEN